MEYDAQGNRTVICGEMSKADDYVTYGGTDGFWGAFAYRHDRNVEVDTDEGRKLVYGIYKVNFNGDYDGDGKSPKRSADDTGGDCHDYHEGIYPGAPEVCDGLVNDCADIADGILKEEDKFDLIRHFKNITLKVSPDSAGVEYSFRIDKEGDADNLYTWKLDAPDGDVISNEGSTDTVAWDSNAPGGGLFIRPGGLYTAGLTATCLDREYEKYQIPSIQWTSTTFYATPNLQDCTTVYLHNGMPSSSEMTQLQADMQQYMEKCLDMDDDGFYPIGSPLAPNTDCDDHDPNTYPGAEEICDGKDNDCDTVKDEELLWTEALLNATMNGLDISSTKEVPFTLRKNSKYPDQTEVMFEIDGKAVDLSSAFPNNYSDGIPYKWAVPGEGTRLVSSVLGVHTGTLKLRCRAPGATQYAKKEHSVDFTLFNSDQCKASVRKKTQQDTVDALYNGCCKDNDNDGHKGYNSSLCAEGDDCDDTNYYIYPSNSEICDGLDNDCDSLTLEEDLFKIVSFKGSDTVINQMAGGVIDFTGVIETPGPTSSLNWNIYVANKTHSGQGEQVTLPWDGKDPSGKIIEPGEYSAVLIASGGGACTANENIKFIVDNPNDKCDMNVEFGSSANVAGGNLFHSQEAISLSGAILPINLGLSYNSLDAYSGPLGTGWTHSYNINIRAGAGSTYVLMDEDGARTLLVPNGDYYTPRSASYPVLGFNDNGSSWVFYRSGIMYRFDSYGRITHIEDRNSNAVVMGYGPYGLQTVTDPGGRTITFSNDVSGHITSVTGPAGNAYTFMYEGGTLSSVLNPDGTYWSYGYDGNAFMTSRTDPMGNTTIYEYDEEHRVAHSIDPEGVARNLSYSPETTSSEFTDPQGNVWTYEYDPSNGLLTARTDFLVRETTYTYDANNNLVSIAEPDGTRNYTYDIYGNTTGISYGNGDSAYFVYNEYNLLTSFTDTNGDVTVFTYDLKGNTTSVTRPDGSVTSYQYDEHGNLETETGPDGSVTSYTYDEAGNVTSVTGSDGKTTTYTYDLFGNMTSMTNHEGNTVTYTYDAYGNMLSVTGVNGETTSYTYDALGNMASVTDASGNTTSYKYDSRGRVVRTVDALGNVTLFGYGDAGCAPCGGGDGNLTSITDTYGNTINFEYDAFGNLIKETDALGNSISYTYDADGNISSKTDKNGNTVLYSYDADRRLVQKTYPDGSVMQNQYDEEGRLTYEGNAHMAYEMAYGSDGRLSTVTDLYGRSISYAYDEEGRRTSMSASGFGTQTYSYDDKGRLASIVSPAGTFTYTYYEEERTVIRSYPNGAKATYSYDEGGRLVSLVHTGLGGKVLRSFAYEFDAVGNRIVKETESDTLTYSYDALYRLVEAASATPGWSGEEGNAKGQGKGNSSKGSGISQALLNQMETYTYDSVGNRLLGPDNNDTYTYNSANQLVSSSFADYEYDLNGNLIYKVTDEGVVLYQYDYENRLVRVEMPTGTVVEFAYGPFGHRIGRAVNGQWTYYFYDNEDILYEYSQSGTIDNMYVHGAGIDEPLALMSRKGDYYYHADGLGSIIALTDASASVVQDYEYDSFGNFKDRKNRIKQPYAFTGREYDRETGLYYYRARYYDAEAGRFTQSDPAGMAGGMNPYAYVLNNPVNLIDPWGMRPLTTGPTSETVLAQSIFGSSIDYSKVEIYAKNYIFGLPLVGRPMTPNGNIYIDPADARYSPYVDTSVYPDGFANGSINIRTTFIHEMAHVWQYQNNIFFSFKLRGIWDRDYDYYLCRTKKLTDYGLEQQAQIIGDYFLLKNGKNVSSSSLNSLYLNLPDYIEVIYRSIKL